MDGRNNFAGGWDVPRPSNFLKAPPRTLLQESDESDEDFVGPSARRQKLENNYGSAELSPNIEPYKRQSQLRRTLLQTPPVTARPCLSDVVCEIFFLDSHDRLYAERVKETLIDQNIVSEISLICPPNGGFIAAIEGAVRRSLMFACTITDQNNLHQSITVHILQGIHQVHRNMPLADAVELIVENFEMLRANKVEEEPQYIGKVAPVEIPFTPPDENLKYLLNLAIDKRFLSVEEMDKVIDYFKERRDELARAEGIKPQKVAKRPLLPDPSTTGTPEEEVSIEKDVRSLIHNQLQDRIFQLLKRPEPPEENPRGTPLSSSAGSSVGGVADDINTMARALEILTSNPLLQQLIGIPCPEINPLAAQGLTAVHHPNAKSAHSAKYDALAAVSSSSAVYFNRGPLLGEPHSSLPPYH